MTSIADVAAFLERYAPPRLAESWDNVGLLVGDAAAPVDRVMTCLTVTPDSAAEAVSRRANLIVAHHPLPFSAVKRLTRDSTVGSMLLDLIAAGVAIYSPHTGFDSAAEGINQRLAEGLELIDIAPLVDHPEGEGTGRFGRRTSPVSLAELADCLKRFLQIDGLHVVGQPDRRVATIAVGCGAAGELLPAACRLGCDAMVLGETRFHTCLEAEALGVALLLPGHFASERFGVECLAKVLAGQFPAMEIWPSQRERDPLRWHA
jgi:dinuclear metal center YbgI/SA1388 family protein